MTQAEFHCRLAIVNNTQSAILACEYLIAALKLNHNIIDKCWCGGAWEVCFFRNVGDPQFDVEQLRLAEHMVLAFLAGRGERWTT